MKAPQAPKGTRDLIYEDAAALRKVIERLRKIFLLGGYSDFDTPGFEYLETLEMKCGPDVSDQIYVFKDKAARVLALIFEFTASLGRVAASNPDLIRPFKRYQIGKVWRYESPQSNRYREFYQADIDIIGPYSMDCEVEIMQLVSSALEKFGVSDYYFLLHNRKLLKAQLSAAGIDSEEQQSIFLRGLDKLDKIGEEKVRSYILKGGQISEEQYDAFIATVPQGEDNSSILSSFESSVSHLPIGREGLDELRAILDLTAEIGFGDKIKLSPSLVRGLDYYTGPIFEVRSPSLGNVSFGGGGRYDQMVEQFGGVPGGAVGFAFGVDRLVAMLKAQELSSSKRIEATVFLAVMDQECTSDVFLLAKQLRDADIPVFQFVGPANARKQFGMASKLAVPWVIAYGKTERESDSLEIKNMDTGEKVAVLKSGVVEFFLNQNAAMN